MTALADFADDLLVTEPGSPERAVVLLDHVLAEEPSSDRYEDSVADVVHNVAELGQVLEDVRKFLRTPNVAKTLKTKDPGLRGALLEAFEAVQGAVNALEAKHLEVMRIE